MIADVQDMQWRIEAYYRINEVLPADLSVVYGKFPTPITLEGRPMYKYETLSETRHQLYATIIHDEFGATARYQSDMFMATPGFTGNNNWDNKAGRWCFERTVSKNFVR